mgnify:CR=1 FL=1|tara:strand:- start:4053 stop:4166 length:114 start_codon:yes stop_codon:yes gene_type:complete
MQENNTADGELNLTHLYFRDFKSEQAKLISFESRKNL